MNFIINLCRVVESYAQECSCSLGSEQTPSQEVSSPALECTNEAHGRRKLVLYGKIFWKIFHGVARIEAGADSFSG